MKQVLILLFAAFFVIGASAQQTSPVKMDQEKLQYDSPVQRQVHFPAELKYTDSEDVSRVYIGMAHNQRSFRREDFTVVSYNEDLDLISVTFIIDEETYTEALSGGTIASFFSEDHGLTWSGPIVLSDFSADSMQNYYQSGIIYNPAGNTISTEAYGVCQSSPLVIAHPDWSCQGFGWSTFDVAISGSTYFTNYQPYDGYFSHFGLTQKGEVIKAFNIHAVGDWPAFTELGLEDIQGTFNGTGFDWDLENSVIQTMPFNVDPADGEPMWVGKYIFSDAAVGMVWSDDYQTGYAWMTGADANNTNAGYQPIIFKTIDGGNNWDYVEIDLQATQWQEFFRDGATEPTNWLLYPCRDTSEEFTDFTIPWFNATAGAVDANGNLQLVGDCSAHYYDIFNDYNYYENINSRYAYAGHLFMFTIGDELLDITWIDSLRSNPALDLTSGTNDSLYWGTIGWLRRLQLSKNFASDQFFVTWTDTRDGNGIVRNYKPDIMGWSYSITAEGQTEPHCYSCGTLFENFYWFTHASEYAMYDAETETYTIPYVNAVRICDFHYNKYPSGDAVGVQYVTGIDFPALSVGVNEGFEAQSNITVSQNIPNPASQQTSFTVVNKENLPLKLTVTNMIGQEIYSEDLGVVNGNKKVYLDLSDFKSGVYFYTLSSGNACATKKMIVR